MALLWVEGGETYRTDNGAISTFFSRKYNTRSFDQQIADGRITGKSIRVGTENHWFETPSLTSDDTLIVGFGFKYSSSSGFTSIFQFYDGGDLNLSLQLTPDQDLLIRRGTNVTINSVATVLVPDTWYYIEFKAVTNSTTGSYELRIDNTTIASDTGVNTKAGNFDYSNRVRFQFNGIAFYDDIYICDSTGSTNNSFLRKQVVTAIYPDGIGNSSAFTPSAAESNYSLVNEPVIDGNVTYVESATLNDIDTYSYGNVVGLNPINGIQVNTIFAVTDISNLKLKTMVRSNATDYEIKSEGASVDYLNSHVISEVDPDDSLRWDIPKINSAEFGIKVG